ncbi:MAG: alpha/beta hydrolase [Alphaproteobacteria bacterium]|nr:alpha/beta hydrolase [Alphaproteobacteria bacterium]
MRLVLDGREVFAATGGRPFDPDLPPLLFVHGAGLDHSIWSLPARHFAHQGWSVLAVDLPGHGLSAGPPLASVAAQADWLGRLLAAVGAAPAAVVGFSMGALASLELAATAPARVRALFLLGAADRMPVHPELLALAKAGNPRAAALATDWCHGRRQGGSDAPGLWVMGGGLRLVERAAPLVLGVDLAACNDYSGAAAAAARVRCPTLVIMAERDQMTPPRAGQALARLISGARTAALAGCGHLMMTEQPNALIDLLSVELKANRS